MIRITSALLSTDFEIIEDLARKILHKFYDPVIPKEHTSYFINKYQTAKAIEAQVKDGHLYYVLEYDGLNVGYLGIIRKSNTLLLDKLYILEAYRGKKIGKKAIEFTHKFAEKLELTKIELIVHKSNQKSIEFYKRMGYTSLGIVPNHFETGQLIENYQMVRNIKPKAQQCV